MPTVRISSMYDLQTSTKFGVIGVHTPTSGQILTKYDGLARNYKFMKLKKCSVKIACASVLPADPLQVGVTAGKISPADMMNPILYRAVSNDAWNDVVSRIYSPGWTGDSADGLDDAFSYLTAAASEKVYYSLLSSPGWRKVMPQQGLSVKGLRPLVHEVVSVFGNTLKGNMATAYADRVTDDMVAGSTTGGNPAILVDKNAVFRGRTLPMPAIPTATLTGTTDSAGLDNGPAVPKTMVLAIVMPFSQLQVMYYRMIVTWDIVFFGLRPATEISISAAQSDGAYTRYTRWSVTSSKELESDSDNVADSVGCVDALNMSPELKMES
nr:MAG: capsid protein [Smacoviridae sp.]